MCKRVEHRTTGGFVFPPTGPSVFAATKRETGRPLDANTQSLCLDRPVAPTRAVPERVTLSAAEDPGAGPQTPTFEGRNASSGYHLEPKESLRV